MALALVVALALSGCGRPAASNNVPVFTDQARSAVGRAVLHSIGIYRTSHNLRFACSFVTPHFLRIRYDNLEQECEYFSGQAPRTLPRSAQVESISAGRARVRIHELTATRSVYVMVLTQGTWKIDDIRSPGH